MTVKVDGTNGVLQNYAYLAPATGFTYTFSSYNVLVLNPTTTLATGTITMPASPVDGMTITITSTKTITALTINANTGQSIVGNVTTLAAGSSQVFIYSLANTTWYSESNTFGTAVTSLNGVTGAVSTVALYDIGSFITGRPFNLTAYAVNSTIAGSSLYSTTSVTNAYDSGSGLIWARPGSGGAANANCTTLINTGSWRCVSPAGTEGAYAGLCGLWVRYA